MTRLPFVLASLFAAACAAEDPAAHGLRPDVDDLDGVLEPGPGPTPSPIEEEPRTCVSAKSGITQFGTTGVDMFRDVLVSSKGSILVSGSERGVYQGATSPALHTRGVVLEYAHDLRSFTKRAQLATLGTDSIESLAVDPDTGKLWFMGRTNEALSDTEARGAFDTVIGELPEAGGLRPRYRGFESTAEHARRLAIAPGGHVAVAGHQLRNGSTDPLLAVFEIEGDVLAPQYTHTRVAPMDERYDALAVSARGAVFGGTIFDSDEQGMFVGARNLQARPLWRTQLSKDGFDRVTAVHVLPDGDVLWAGHAISQVGETAHGGLDIVVGRLDGTTGASKWIVQHGGATDETVADLAVDADGRIYLTGHVAADGGDVDAYMLALDAEGNPLANEVWGSTGNDRPAAITVDACGVIVIAGTTNGDLGGANSGGDDGFVLVTRLTH